jgi:predicted anti-sigma-YlaC factor YlaD
MTCAHAATWLQLYVDGRLHVRHLARLEAHLDTCATCRQDLVLLEVICEAATVVAPLQEPAQLTHAIMSRVAALEARRAAATSQRRFGVGWADALLAGAMATVATLVFLLFQPGLRQTASLAMSQTVVPLERSLAAFLVASSSWFAWLVWIGIGLLITVCFAGGEVRAEWRRSLMARLQH